MSYAFMVAPDAVVNNAHDICGYTQEKSSRSHDHPTPSTTYQHAPPRKCAPRSPTLLASGFLGSISLVSPLPA